MEKVWRLHSADDDLVQSLSPALKLSPLTTQVLVNRGLSDPASAAAFLHPKLSDLRDPLEIPNMAGAARQTVSAKGAKICVFGDYDVDGVTGTAILLQTLRFLGLEASYYIPHRYGEGYGLSLDSIQTLHAQGIKLIVTVDCGISSRKEIARANELGMPVIVTDHHNLPEELPPADFIINPKMLAEGHPSKYLSGAGVAFKFAWALLRAADIKDNTFLTSLLDLAALGTISDVVPLVAENRILAVKGLALISERRRPGIKKLAECAGIKGPITVDRIYFGLAPRINAAGRLEHASKAVELFTTVEPEKISALAAELCEINVRRRDIGEAIREEVFSQIDSQTVGNSKIIVLAGRDWHPGVIGIVASRVVDLYYRPTILIGVTDGVGRGSARSADGVNIFKLLAACRDLFLDFGGHEGAAGFEIEEAKIPELIERLKVKVDELISPEELIPRLEIDAELDPARITLSLIKELDLLDPHGEGNPPPVFMSRGLTLTDLRKVGAKGKHLKVKLTDGRVNLEAIGFGLGDLANGKPGTPQIMVGYNYDIAYELEANEWNGFESAQLSLIDIKEAKQ